VQEVKENKKYHFAIYAIINELLIIKYCHIDSIASAREDAAALRSSLLGAREVVFYKRQ